MLKFFNSFLSAKLLQSRIARPLRQRRRYECFESCHIFHCIFSNISCGLIELAFDQHKSHLRIFSVHSVDSFIFESQRLAVFRCLHFLIFQCVIYVFALLRSRLVFYFLVQYIDLLTVLVSYSNKRFFLSKSNVVCAFSTTRYKRSTVFL